MYKRIFLYYSALITGLLFVSTSLRAQVSQEAALREHVRILTADSLSGRGVGTEGEKRAAAYISHCFESYGLEFIYPKGVQDFSVIGQKGDTLSSQNIVGIVVGSDPKLKEEYIVIGAHYDHLGIRNITINGRDSLVLYPGGDDNASGIAMLLEMAQAAAHQPYLFKRSLVFVAFGAEEMGMIGAWYFVNRAFSAINQVVLMINLDMLGRSGAKNPFSAYTVEPHGGLSYALQYVAEFPLTAQPKIISTDYFPSDHQIFFAQKIPSVLFTSGIHTDYHTPRDKYNLLDYNEMERRMTFIFSFLQHLSNDESWNRGIHSETIYTMSSVEKPPTFQRGDERQFLKQWVNKYVKYPKNAVAQGIQGTVMVQFVIEANGEVNRVEVVESVDPLLDDEAVRVISASPKWKPGSKDGKSVPVRCVVPVYFILKRR